MSVSQEKCDTLSNKKIQSHKKINLSPQESLCKIQHSGKVWCWPTVLNLASAKAPIIEEHLSAK